MNKYVMTFSQNGKEFDFDATVPDNVKPEDRLEHLDERAQKLADANGWIYVGVGPKLDESDFDFARGMTR